MNRNNILETIYVYTRRKTRADGMMIDVSKLAEDLGFTQPIALTFTVWSLLNAIPENYPQEHEESRPWETLWMLLKAIKQNQEEDPFNIVFCGQNSPRKTITLMLKAHCPLRD